MEPAPDLLPSAIAEGKAAQVELEPGEAIANVDIAIQEMLPIRLAIKAQLAAAPAPPASEPNNPGERLQPYLIVWISPAEDVMDVPHQSFVLSTERRYESRALQPGRYVLHGNGHGRRQAPLCQTGGEPDRRDRGNHPAVCLLARI
ncbi:MAG: hypothetical protein QM757_04820 [Paludibaculum sp.]